MAGTIQIPSSAVSGYYVVQLRLSDGPYRGGGVDLPFVVRELRPRAKLLVQAAVNTWEAYNDWGGKSLYEYNSTGNVAAVKVSFNRPFDETSRNSFWSWEYPIARFLERNGVDAAYTTDVDTDADPGSLTAYNAVLVAGHDEYWTQGERDAFTTARDAGTNLIFLGADIGDSRIRYDDGRKVIVDYRTPGTDPDIGDPTGRFRDISPSLAQCNILGTEYESGALRSDADPSPAMIVTPAAVDLPWATGTGLAAGMALAGVAGYEWDQAEPGCAPGRLSVLFDSGGRKPAQSVLYQAPSGATVFSAGTLQIAWALDGWGGHSQVASPALQAFMLNMLDDLTH